MTQRARVFQMLQNAGSEGIRSDEFFKAYMPRAAARIQELRDEGYEIESEREGKYCRYRLVGHTAGSAPVVGRADACRDASSVSGRGSTGGRGQPEGHVASLPNQAADKAPGAPARSVPNCFDFDADWSDAA